MRSRLVTWALAGFCASGVSAAADLTGKPVGPTPPAAKSSPETDVTCGSHGTSVDFVATPSEAAARARKEQKLVFVLHVSGHFETPEFT